MKKILVLFLALFSFSILYCQDDKSENIKLIFIGDIMQHTPQINSAWNGKNYDYSENFKYLLPLFNYADFVIGNLETTFNGAPYTGYPAFSAPDDLAGALKRASVDILVTANNHSLDKGINGLIRTINVLDSLYINHTGTFKNKIDFQKNHPLIIQKDDIRLAILNYTYGTNALLPTSSIIINLIDTNEIKDDLLLAKSYNPDGIIIYFHWGEEYQRLPNNYQKTLAEFCIKNGAHYIIGSHPHVIQPMIKSIIDTVKNLESIVYYSLGNFISNQRWIHTDGGAIAYLEFTKNKDGLQLSQAGYLLSWTWKKLENNRYKYINLPAWKYDKLANLYPEDMSAMKFFLDSTRVHLNKYNVGIQELYFDEVQNVIKSINMK